MRRVPRAIDSHDESNVAPVEKARPVLRLGRQVRNLPLWFVAVVIGTVAFAGSTFLGGHDSRDSAPNRALQAGSSVTHEGADVTSADGDIVMKVAFDVGSVEPGGHLGVTVSVENRRTTDLVLGRDSCGSPVSMIVALPVPFSPTSASWSGIAATFKDYALEKGGREGGVPATTPVAVFAQADQCTTFGEQSIPAGGSFSSHLTWSANIVSGVPAGPGSVPFSIRLAYDPGPSPSVDLRQSGPFVSQPVRSKSLTLTGSLLIQGNRPKVVSAEAAIDAVLGSPRFAKWLDAEDPDTWSAANVFLTDVVDQSGSAEPVAGADVTVSSNSIAPAGPSWEIDLFRENGVARNWAIAFVDPSSGTIRSLSICDLPCDR